MNSYTITDRKSFSESFGEAFTVAWSISLSSSLSARDSVSFAYIRQLSKSTVSYNPAGKSSSFTVGNLGINSVRNMHSLSHSALLYGSIAPRKLYSFTNLFAERLNFICETLPSLAKIAAQESRNASIFSGNGLRISHRRDLTL